MAGSESVMPEILPLCKCGCGEKIPHKGRTYKDLSHMKGRKTFLGKHHTSEAKEKQRQARLGKSPSNKGTGIGKITVFYCLFCNKEFSKYSNTKYLIAKYCSKICRAKHIGISKGPWNRGKKGVQIAWNKGLTKETNESVARISNSVLKRQQEGFYDREGYRPYYGKISYYWSKEQNKIVRFRSSYELIFAEYMDANNIVWEYEPKRFILTNKTSYLPDFFLKTSNFWYEVKGYWRDKARLKFELFCQNYPDVKIAIINAEDIGLMKKGLFLRNI